MQEAQRMDQNDQNSKKSDMELKKMGVQLAGNIAKRKSEKKNNNEVSGKKTK
jgi:hypothetical protein